jgi:hypothetical protein
MALDPIQFDWLIDTRPHSFRGGLVVKADAHRTQINEHDGQDLPLGRVISCHTGAVIIPVSRATATAIPAPGTRSVFPMTEDVETREELM